MHSSPQVFLRLYVSGIGETISCVYASQIWNFHLIKHINQLEVIQEFALKICFKSWSNFGYSDLLHYSNLPSLADRRRFLNLRYFSKLANHAIDFPIANSPLTPHILNYPNRQWRISLCMQLLLLQIHFYTHSFPPPFLSGMHALPQSILFHLHHFTHSRGHCILDHLVNH